MSQPGAAHLYTSGLVPPSAEGAGIIIGDCVMLAFATAWTVLRVVSRRQLPSGLLAEDYMHIFALVCFYGTVGLSIAMVCAGVGRHMNEIPPSHIVTILQYSFGSQVLYAVSLGLIKISICWTLARIFSMNRVVVISARALMGLSAAWAIMTILIGLLICRPVQKNWGTTMEGHCGNQNAGFSSVTVYDLIIDFIILLLPIRPVLRLQLPLVNRLGLLAIFSMGLLTMIFAAIRLDAVLHLDFADFPYGVRMSHIWTMSENGVALIVSSSIYLRPVFDRAFRTLMSLGSRDNGRGISEGHGSGGSQDVFKNRARPWDYANLTADTELEPIRNSYRANRHDVERFKGGHTELDHRTGLSEAFM